MTVDQRAHATAIKTVINASLAPYQAYDPDELPATRPAVYVEIYLSRRPNSIRRVNGSPGVTLWRLQARYVAKTDDNARLALLKTTQAVEGLCLPIGSDATTTVEFVTEQPIGPDDGWYVGTTEWSYGI